MLQSLSNLWNKIRTWFKDSETIFLARATVFGGILYAGLMGVDWNQLASLNFADGISKPEMYEAAKWIGLGIITEVARRNRADL